jgi:hypothetical protein
LDRVSQENKKMIADAYRVGSGDRLAKGDMKIRIFLGAILVSATMLGINELASAVTRADHGSLPAAANDISVRN